MENIYKIILEDTLAGYWDWNIPANTEYLSPSFKSMFGYQDHELENKPESWQKIIFPQDLELVLQKYNEHVSSKGAVPFKCEARYKHKHGDTVWVLCTGRVVEWDNDEPIRMIGCHIDISKQKEAEEDLRETQQLLNQTGETARVGGWELDLEKQVMTWTKVTKDIHEVGQDYIPNLEEGINFYKEGESRDAIAYHFQKSVTEGGGYDLELQIVTAKGREVWVRAIADTEFRDGKCVRTYGTFQDIDEQKKIQLRLELSEKHFRDAFNYSAIGMALVGLDGRWMQVNKQVCDLLGYSEEEMLSKTFQDITHPDDLELDLNNVQALLEGKVDSYQMEKRYFHKYGHLVWVLLGVSLIRDNAGKPMHFISQLEDITQRKLAEEQLNKVNEELTTLYSAMKHVSVIATDLNGVITHFSKGSEMLLGYNADEMIKKKTPSVIHVEEEVVKRGEELSGIYDKQISGFDVFVENAKRGEQESREWTYVRKDGSTFPVQLVVSSIENTAGDIIGFLGIATDISERKKAEHKLKDTLEIVNEQNTRLFNFAHIVSHNLRSHAGNLEMMLQLMKDAQTEEEKEVFYNHLHSISSHLSDTILHLNEVVTIQTNINQQREDIHLHKYVTDTLGVLAADIERTGAKIENTVPNGAIINYNKAYIESILLNLLSNALKYRASDRDPVVKISLEEVGGRSVFSVSDNGKGIDLEKHGKKLFGMYKTFHGNEDARGIGLFITKNQIEAMGGKIEVDSELNKGTTFTITL